MLGIVGAYSAVQNGFVRRRSLRSWYKLFFVPKAYFRGTEVLSPRTEMLSPIKDLLQAVLM